MSGRNVEQEMDIMPCRLRLGRSKEIESSAYQSHRPCGDNASPDLHLPICKNVVIVKNTTSEDTWVYRESITHNTSVLVASHGAAPFKTISPGGQVFTDVDAQG